MEISMDEDGVLYETLEVRGSEANNYVPERSLRSNSRALLVGNDPRDSTPTLMLMLRLPLAIDGCSHVIMELNLTGARQLMADLQKCLTLMEEE